MRIEKTGDMIPQELLVKRFYIPYKFYDDCPNCGQEVEYDDYFSYPVFGAPLNIYFMCIDCEDKSWEDKTIQYEDYNWERQIIIDLIVTEEVE